ncbi:hypothetical protein BGZ73_005592 [Actinomortierella ambigua]|nr:hypothetical protein BGZ73_005592 [Actinomortierella ambigua]
MFKKQGLSKKGSKSKFATVATTTSPWSAASASLYHQHYQNPNGGDGYMATATTGIIASGGGPVPSTITKPGISESVTQYDFSQIDRWYSEGCGEDQMIFNVVEQQEYDGRIQEREVVYSIRVECSTKILLLSRRISDFVEFDKKVKAKFPKLRPVLPFLDDQRRSFLATTKQFFFPRKNTAEKLESYLSKVASHPPLCQSDIFQEFLAVSEEGDLMHAKDNRYILRDSLLQPSSLKTQESTDDLVVPCEPMTSSVGGELQQGQPQQQHLYSYARSEHSYQSQMPPLPPPPQQQHHDHHHPSHYHQHPFEQHQQQEEASLQFQPLPPSGQSFYPQSPPPASMTESQSPLRGGRGGKARPGIPSQLQQLPPPPPAPPTTATSQPTAALPLANRKISIQDFDMCTVLGRGCMGKVILVREKQSRKLFALKIISKEWVILQREIEHTKSERNILAHVAKISHPFLIKLRHSFQDNAQLFMVLDFYPGGDIATQLAKFHKFEPPRCLFYTAEIVLGIEELHRLGIVYRDLKPENILLAMDGHIVLTDFGLSKQFPSLNGSNNGYVNNEKTSTFCGTAEYLAPEILLAYEYSYEVDWWSLGTLLFEMLSGITPFWADNHAIMYRRVLEDELEFPVGIDPDARSFISGLLERDPRRRLGYGSNGARAVKRHPYFKGIDWHKALQRRLPCPYVPELTSEEDLRNFDDTFLTMTPRLSPGNHTLSNSIQNCFQGYSYTMASSVLPAGGGALPRTDSKMQTSTTGQAASVQSSYKDHLMNHGPTPHQSSYRGGMMASSHGAQLKQLRPAGHMTEDPRLAPSRAQPLVAAAEEKEEEEESDGPFTDVDMHDGDDVVMQEGQDGDMEDNDDGEDYYYENGQPDVDRVHQDLFGYKFDEHHIAPPAQAAVPRPAPGARGPSCRHNSGGSSSSSSGYIPPSAAIVGVEVKGQATVDMHVRRSSSANSGSATAALMSSSPSVARHSVHLTGLNIINGGLSTSSSTSHSGAGDMAASMTLPASPTTPTMATMMSGQGQGAVGGRSRVSSPSSTYSPTLPSVADEVDAVANGHVIAVVTTTLGSGSGSTAADILRGYSETGAGGGGPRHNSTSSSRSSDTIGRRLSRSFM